MTYRLDLLRRSDLASARDFFALACAASRAWDSALRDACAAHGGHGPLVSGAGRDHFPAPVKEELRTLARLVTIGTDLAHEARPRRVHEATIRALGQAVATRDGSGRYGPQPVRGWA